MASLHNFDLHRPTNAFVEGRGIGLAQYLDDAENPEIYSILRYIDKTMAIQENLWDTYDSNELPIIQEQRRNLEDWYEEVYRHYQTRRQANAR